MRPKGMQSIASLRGAGERKVVSMHELTTGRGDNRAKLSTSLARLEHERAGLRDRLGAHAAIRTELETRLQQVDDQLALLKARLDAIPNEVVLRSSQAGRRAAGDGVQDTQEGSSEGADSSSSYRVVSLDY